MLVQDVPKAPLVMEALSPSRSLRFRLGGLVTGVFAGSVCASLWFFGIVVLIVVGISSFLVLLHLLHLLLLLLLILRPVLGGRGLWIVAISHFLPLDLVLLGIFLMSFLLIYSRFSISNIYYCFLLDNYMPVLYSPAFVSRYPSVDCTPGILYLNIFFSVNIITSMKKQTTAGSRFYYP